MRRGDPSIAFFIGFCIAVIVMGLFVILSNTAKAYPLYEDVEASQTEEAPYSEADVEALAKMAAGEYFLCSTPGQKQQCAAVMWVACWRSMKGGTIPEAVSAPYQFHGYSPYNTVTPELRAMAEDVLTRYHRCLAGEDPQAVGAVLPPDYLWFFGNGTINIFRNSYIGGAVWGWEWGNPYDDE